MRFLLATALFALSLCAAQDPTVALTFDDLPSADTTDPEAALRMNQGILLALKRFHAPAIGFVNQKMVETLGRKPLRGWQQNLNSLGNHTYAHLDLNSLTVAQFQQEVILGEPSLPTHPRWLRFPFNHAGDTAEKQAAVQAFLATRGYRIAACTIDNEDYEWSRTYDLLLAQHALDDAGRLRAEYLTYTASKIDYYSELHTQIFGRPIPHVMLLHVNQLNADTIQQTLEIFKAKHYRFVTLDIAQSDPAYRTPLPQATAYGPMWGYRWAKALGIKVDGSREPSPPEWVLHRRQVSAQQGMF